MEKGLDYREGEELSWCPSSVKRNFMAYRSSKVPSRPDCIFEIHQLWQSGFSRVYSNSCCSCSFEIEIIKIDQSSHKMYSNNILNFQATKTILMACTKKVWKPIEGTTYLDFCFEYNFYSLYRIWKKKFKIINFIGIYYWNSKILKSVWTYKPVEMRYFWTFLLTIFKIKCSKIDISLESNCS